MNVAPGDSEKRLIHIIDLNPHKKPKHLCFQVGKKINQNESMAKKNKNRNVFVFKLFYKKFLKE